MPRDQRSWKRGSREERDAETAMQIELRRQKVPAGVIYDTINDLRESKARQSALGEGLPESVAADIGKRARLSRATFKHDLEKARKLFNSSIVTNGRGLIVDRIAELEDEKETLVLAERRCWERFNAETEASPVRDITPGAAELLAPASTSASARWIASIVQIVEARVKITGEQFRLKALLGIETPAELKELVKRASGGDEAATRELQAKEVGLLYSLEAAVAGLDPNDHAQRLKTVSAFLGTGGEGGGGTSAGGGIAAKVTFEVRGIWVEEDPRST